MAKSNLTTLIFVKSFLFWRAWLDKVKMNDWNLWQIELSIIQL